MVEEELIKKKASTFAKSIFRDAKKEESFGTGLMGEQIIIASYKKMSIDQLEKMRYIINKIIKQKKELKRAMESKT